MPKKYVIGLDVANKTAGGKAAKDITKIAEEMGYIPVKYKVKGRRIRQSISKIQFFSYLKRIQEGGIVLLQYPLAGQVEAPVADFFCRHPKYKLLLLIHDLDILRSDKSSKDVSNMEIRLLKRADAIICHNQEMNRMLRTYGVDEGKCINLKLFDYLYDFMPERAKKVDKKVIVAGNLSRNKSKYVYMLNEIDRVDFDLYGINYDGTTYPNIHYFGAYGPEELPQKFNGGFGLVWDGDQLTTCSGNFGEYLRYNNPHKLSLYLAAGLPVIVWKESAVYSFVKEKKVGIGVDSLLEVPVILEKMTAPEIEEMMNRVSALSRELSIGTYTKLALNHAERIVI